MNMRGGENTMANDELNALKRKAFDAGRSEMTGCVNELLSEVFSDWCKENGVPYETDWTDEDMEKYYRLRLAFEAGYGICMHGGTKTAYEVPNQ
jgi:hypothetical protein